MTQMYVARAATDRGDIVLRRREDDDALELRVNGTFVMDTLETETERLLATITLDALPHTIDQSPSVTAVVGGLGLGFTVAEVLDDPRVDRVVVAEIEPSLVEWHRHGLVPGSPIGDDRVDVQVADIRDVIAQLGTDSVDAILLDVDNGPDALVYETNADVYSAEFLDICRAKLRPPGLLAVWSAATAPALLAALADTFGRCEQRVLPVRLGRRETSYHVFLAASA